MKGWWRLGLAITGVILLLSGLGYAAFEALEAPDNVVLGAALTHGIAGHRAVALTFDDGPNPPYTERILDVLEREHARATFFVVGRAVEAHPETIKAIVNEGSAVGIHGWDHEHMELESDDALIDNIMRTKAAIEHAGAPAGIEGGLEFVRPPFGQRGLTTIRTLAAHGFRTVLWSVPLSEDWRQPGVDAIVERSLRGVSDGAIIVLHDGDRGRSCADDGGSCSREQEVAATRAIVRALRARGYALVTIPEMFGMRVRR